MRDLTDTEKIVLVKTREMWEVFLELPEIHPADTEEFVLSVHALQNIVLARPATESLNANQGDEDEQPEL